MVDFWHLDDPLLCNDVTMTSQRIDMVSEITHVTINVEVKKSKVLFPVYDCTKQFVFSWFRYCAIERYFITIFFYKTSLQRYYFAKISLAKHRRISEFETRVSILYRLPNEKCFEFFLFTEFFIFFIKICCKDYFLK